MTDLFLRSHLFLLSWPISLNCFARFALYQFLSRHVGTVGTKYAGARQRGVKSALALFPPQAPQVGTLGHSGDA